MKKLLLIFMVVGLYACDKEDSEDEAIGNYSTESWVLTEEYYDPGDGSGDFVASTESFSISWEEDNSFTSTGNLCSFSFNDGTSSSGTFDVDTEQLIINNCENTVDNTVTLYYDLNEEESELLIYLPCIEACVLKFQKVIAL